MSVMHRALVVSMICLFCVGCSATSAQIPDTDEVSEFTQSPTGNPSPTQALNTDTALPPARPTRRPTATATASPTPLSLPTAYATIPADWQTYGNTEYGFAFQYPCAWTLIETPAFEREGEKYGTFIRLSRDDVTLTIGYKRAGETDTRIGCTGTAAGDLIEGGAIQFLDQPVSITRLVYENKLKTVFFGDPCSEIERDPLVFFIALNGTSQNFDEQDIATSLIDETIQILLSFTFLQ